MTDTTATEVVNETPVAAAPSLGLNDLVAVIQIIDVVSKRGAFEGSELESVGAGRTRISAFLDAHKKPAEPTEEASAEDEAPTEFQGS